MTLLRALALLVLVACLQPCNALAVREFEPQQLHKLPASKPDRSVWLMSWPLASRGADEGDDVGRALSDLLAFGAFQHVRAVRGGQSVLWRTHDGVEHRAFRDARAELATSGVDLVVHGRYQEIGGDYLLLPRVTVLGEPGSKRSRVQPWTADLTVEGTSFSFDAGLPARSFELPQVVVPRAVVEQYTKSSSWLVCASRPGPSGCQRPVGVVSPSFVVRSFEETEGGMLLEVASRGGPEGWVFVPLGPDVLQGIEHFVAGLADLHTGQNDAAAVHFRAVATAKTGTTAEMVAHSELYTCLALTNSARGRGEGAPLTCSDHLEKARLRNPYDRTVAEYQVMELVRRVKTVETMDDAVRREAVLLVFDEGIRDLEHQLGGNQRAVLERFGERVQIERIRQERSDFLLETDQRPRGRELRPGQLRRIERALPDEDTRESTGTTEPATRRLLDLQVESGARVRVDTLQQPTLDPGELPAALGRQSVDYLELMDRILDAEAVLKVQNGQLEVLEKR